MCQAFVKRHFLVALGLGCLRSLAEDLQADTADECLETLDGDCALHTLQIAAKYQPGNDSWKMPTEDLLWAKYQVFLLEYGRLYGAEEQHQRFENFKRHFRRTQHLSGSGLLSDAFGINSFSDFYAEELPLRGLKADFFL